MKTVLKKVDYEPLKKICSQKSLSFFNKISYEKVKC